MVTNMFTNMFINKFMFMHMSLEMFKDTFMLIGKTTGEMVKVLTPLEECSGPGSLH